MTVVYKDKTYPSKNEIVKIEGGIATLRNVRQDMVFTVSEEDLPKILRCTWSVNSNGYLCGFCPDSSRRKSGIMLLHQLVLGYPEEGFTIDHIDRDKLNNCRPNLRVVSFRVNAINTKRVDASFSRFIGVRKSGNSFAAQFTKSIYLCQSKQEILCAFYYDRYVALHFPNEPTNFSLGLYPAEDLAKFNVNSIADIVNMDFDLKRVKVDRFWGVSLSIRRKLKFEGRVRANYKFNCMSSFSERIAVIRRELFLDSLNDSRSKRNDLLSLFIPQPGQKFIIPRYVNDEGEVVDCSF